MISYPNFYQSTLRNELNREIYGKPTFEATILGRTYQWVIKQQRRLGKTFRRCMIHGLEWVLDEDWKRTKAHRDQLLADLERLQRDHGSRWWDVFLQLGILDPVARFTVAEIKKDGIAEAIVTKQSALDAQLNKDFAMQVTFREHMPQATVLIDCDNYSRTSLSSSWKRYVNKGAKAWLTLEYLTKKDEREQFRSVRYAVGYDKAFNVLPKEQFLALMTHIHETKQGFLAVWMHEGKIVTGGVYLTIPHSTRSKKLQWVYLYGATDRAYWAIGAQYRLMDQIAQVWTTIHGRTSLDLLGVAPVGDDTHHLAWVTRFKQAFGGEHISYAGSYDIVWNALLYKTFKIMKTRSLR